MSVVGDRVLLVPMHVDALAVEGDEGRNRAFFQWTCLAPDFGKLGKEFFLGPDLAGDPFRETAPLERGVHLHFRLPRAFTRGRQADKAQLSFPVVPNRWLVQRFADGPRSHRAWLVRSDAEGDGKGYAWPLFPDATRTQYAVRRIGSWIELAAPPERETTIADRDRPRLTAVGPGDPLFSAHYQACRAVLGFHDDLVDVHQAARLSYLVTGWFSDQNEDPLWAAMHAQREDRPTPWRRLREWLHDQDWRLDDPYWPKPVPRAQSLPEPETEPPLRILCHALVRGLAWNGPSPADPLQEPADLAVKHDIAIGQTTAEALATLYADARVEQDLLTALQDNLLNDGFTAEVLRSSLHARRFDSVPGGTTFSLRPEAGPRTAPSEAIVPTSAELPADLAELLDALNAAQARCDTAARRAEDCRRQLHALWYLMTAELKRAADEARISSLEKQYDAFRIACETAMGTLTAAESARDTIYADVEPKPTGRLAECLAAYARADADDRAPYGGTVEPEPIFRLTRSPAQAFHAASEPAIAIRGPAMGPFNTAVRTGELACRLGTQVAAGLELKLPGGPTVEVRTPWLVDKVLGARPPTVDDLHYSLLGEALLLDVVYTDQIAEKACERFRGGRVERIVEELKSVVTRLQQRDAELGDEHRVTGLLPDPLSRFDRSTGNPWNPIVLVWEVAWRPDPTIAGDGALGPDAVLARWRLEDGGESSGPADATQGAHSIVGQSLLTPDAARGLRERLAKLDESLKLVDELRHQRVVAQSLAGFNPALVMRQLRMLLPPLDYDHWADSNHELRLDPVHKLVASGEAPLRLAPGRKGDPFLPVRAGRLEIRRLNVVDGFGRTLKLWDSKRDPVGATLRVSQSCRVLEGAQPVAHLQPRLMQPARLRVEWGGEEGKGAVCGWIVPNYLDISLTIHAANGRPLGILQKKLGQRALTDDKFAFFWRDVPGATQAGAGDHGEEDASVRVTALIENEDLRDFCLWVLSLDPGAGATLFSLISEQVAASDERVPEADATLSVLVGQPLVLARGRLRLETAGLPVHKPELRACDGTRTEDLGAALGYCFDTRAAERVRWPVRLGDRRARNDALVGFFGRRREDGASVRFQPAWGRAEGATARFQPKWGPKEAARGHAFWEQNLAIDGVDPVPLVFLMDPQARVHMTSGVLPVTTFELPPGTVAARRRAHEAFFQTAPVLGFGETPEMPRPSDDYGEWSWLWRPDVTHWRAAPELVEAAERGGFTDRWPRVSEGWLRLLIEPLRILSFWVRDAEGPVPPHSRVRLAWVVQGAEWLQLCRIGEGGREEALQTWKAPPFPATHTVLVERETTFRLKASGEGAALARELTVRVGGGKT